MKSRFLHANSTAPGGAILAKRYVERHNFDEQYVRRLAQRDSDTEDHFVAYFGDLLTIKLRSRLRHADLVHDARQETLMRVLNVLRNKGGISTPQALGAYVNSVCNNVLFEMYRSEAKMPTLTEDLPDLPSRETSVEARLVHEQDRARVRQVLAALPDKDRLILYRIFFEEKDKDDVCKEFGVDREYLRVLVHRAKLRFRSGLAKAEGA
jgi:RNA polymerase sigma-70 factor (ECF subfamily)